MHASVLATPRAARRRNALIAGVLGLWLAVVLGAMGALWRYKLTPGAAAETAILWPAESRLARVPDLPTIIVFAHPLCPCTLATLAELREVASRLDGRASIQVSFWAPADSTASDSWSTSESWRAAASIPGVRTVKDPGGAEAHRFGALTSGHVVLFDRDGRLRFSGGITAARGHVGDNPARARLLALADGAAGAADPTPVFGCPLESSKGR